jgi:hypothetical protein
VEEMLNWLAKEVKDVPDTVWRLNDNFVVLGIEGVLNMLNGEGCQELTWLRDLAISCDTAMLEDVTGLAWQIVRKWWKPHGLPKALRRLEAARATTVCDFSN